MDIALVFDGQEMTADLLLEDGLLATEEGLKTAIAISLFTDARAANDDELPQGVTDRRGWWGDMLAPAQAVGKPERWRIGSRLWLLFRAKQTEETRRRAIDYAAEALAWLVDDGIAAAVEVDAAWISDGWLEFSVDVIRPDRLPERFKLLWRSK